MAALETIQFETGPQPATTIIVLHGLGADGNDFEPIAQQLNLAAVGDVRFVFPHAPIMPVTINNGFRMRAWYDIAGPDLVRREDEAGLRQSLAAVEELLGREKQRGVPANRMVLAGFSQAALAALGYPLQWHEYPMGHSVNMEEIADLNRWLLEVLASA